MRTVIVTIHRSVESAVVHRLQPGNSGLVSKNPSQESALDFFSLVTCGQRFVLVHHALGPALSHVNFHVDRWRPLVQQVVQDVGKTFAQGSPIHGEGSPLFKITLHHHSPRRHACQLRDLD